MTSSLEVLFCSETHLNTQSWKAFAFDGVSTRHTNCYLEPGAVSQSHSRTRHSSSPKFMQSLLNQQVQKSSQHRPHCSAWSTSQSISCSHLFHLSSHPPSASSTFKPRSQGHSNQGVWVWQLSSVLFQQECPHKAYKQTSSYSSI